MTTARRCRASIAFAAGPMPSNGNGTPKPERPMPAREEGFPGRGTRRARIDT